MPTGLFNVIGGLQKFGVGTKVTRTLYDKFPETYWVVTRVQLSKKIQGHGKAWGRLVWRGLPKEKDSRIGAPLKKQWSVVSFPDYGKFQGTREELDQIIADSKSREHDYEKYGHARPSELDLKREAAAKAQAEVAANPVVN